VKWTMFVSSTGARPRRARLDIEGAVFVFS